MEKHSKTGLALGGGAVLGAAHVGVLQALEEANIKIDFITGTSIGAFVAVFYAFGIDLGTIEKIAKELKWIDIANITLSKYGLLSNEKLGELINEYIGDKNLEDSDIPLAIIATDVASGEKVVLDKGPVANAIMASTCIPGIFKPVEIDGLMLVDGGIVENVPIDTIKKLGAEFVIGVDLNANHKYDKPDNILDVILNSFHFIMKHSVKYQTAIADLLIKPDLSAFNRSDIKQVEDLMQKGYLEAKNSLKMLDE